MSICWHCYWGWPKAVINIYNTALEKLNNFESVLHYGPSHIVWEDENWSDDNIKFCLKSLKQDYQRLYSDNYSKEEIEICKWSLEKLLEIPYKERDYEPEDYDDKHPENYPPPKEVVMVKK